MQNFCPDNSRDSNEARFSIAREQCLGKLPVATAAIASSATIEIIGGPADDQSVAVNGNVYVFGIDPGEIDNTGSAIAIATALQAAISSDPDLQVSRDSAVLTISYANTGPEGDLIELSTTDTINVVLSSPTLQGGANQIFGPQFLQLEPNSFGDFSSGLTKASRSFVTPDRQKRKGRTVGSDPASSYNTDVTPTSIERFYPAMFHALPVEMPTNRSSERAIGADVVTAVTAANGISLQWNGDQLYDFQDGMLVRLSNFSVLENNGLFEILSVTETGHNQVDIQLDPPLVDEAGSVDQAIEAVGFQLDQGDAEIQVNGNVVSLVTTAFDFEVQAPQIFPGVWFFIGGDASDHILPGNLGYARCRSISANEVVIDNMNFDAVAEVGAGTSLRLFVGNTTQNRPNPDDQVEIPYRIERQLGSSQDGAQAEYIEGAVLSEMSIELAEESKITSDLSFMGRRRTYRSGSVGDELIEAERFSILEEEEAYNTSNDLVVFSITINDETSSRPENLVGFVKSGTLSFSNNVSGNKALSVLGNLDFQYGDFEVSGNMEAYFQTVEEPRDIENDVDAGIDLIAAFENRGFAISLPLLQLNGGNLTVEKDVAIMIPVETMATVNDMGFTATHTFFPYLPNVALPEQK